MSPEEKYDLLFDLESAFYRDFSALVNEYLKEVPEDMRDELKMRMGEQSSVYGSSSKYSFSRPIQLELDSVRNPLRSEK